MVDDDKAVDGDEVASSTTANVDEVVDSVASPLSERLRSRKREDWEIEKKIFEAALRGECVPQNLGLPLTHVCLVRGIRYNYGFAQELHGTLDLFTRALNARSIMSNVIPNMNPERPEEFPYCIWHPEIASEKTYQDLVRRYPQMAYQVGRACAVAGYIDLFLSLDILPEVHIAEEARESGNTAIFKAIMDGPVKYAVMDDYTRSIHVGEPRVASLNGDTAIRRFLDHKQKIKKPVVLDDEGFPVEKGWCSQQGFKDLPFNITEDMSVDEENNTLAYSMYPPDLEDVSPLLYTPLPKDLPTVEKNLLIRVAAYYGDIDRYSRLRRPEMIEDEMECVLHGLYHNTMFAKWWSLRDSEDWPLQIDQALKARSIMNNDLSWIATDKSPHSVPYLIWHPTLAANSTYRELARRKPEMKKQILRASIVGGSIKLFDELVNDVIPDKTLVREASRSTKPHFSQELERRIREVGEDEFKSQKVSYWWEDQYIQQKRASTYPHLWIRNLSLWGGLYGGTSVDASPLEVWVSIPDEWKQLPEDTALEYDEWPPKNWYTPTDVVDPAKQKDTGES